MWQNKIGITSRAYVNGQVEVALVPRLAKLPWIPGELQWLGLLGEFRGEPVRNRVMLALAYDAALRREELCSLCTDDVDPAHRTLRIRTETTKNRLERVVPYSAPTGGAVVGVPRAPRVDQPGPGAAVSGGVAAQSRAAAEPVDLVEGGPPDRPGLRRRAVLHAHDPAPLPDRPGQDGLGGPRDRRVRRAPSH